jgi:drug/metabolite transporter (DMT)-like permease
LLLTLGMIAKTFGKQLSSPTNATIIITSYVIFTPILYSIKHRRPLTPLIMVTAVLAFSGVVIISFDGLLLLNRGDVMLVIGVLMFSFHFIQLKSAAHFDTSLSLATIQLFTMTLLSCVFLPFLRSSMHFDGFVFIIYLGIVSSGFAFFLQNYGQKLVTSSSVSVIMTFEAIFGVVASIIFFKEFLSFQLFVSAFFTNWFGLYT